MPEPVARRRGHRERASRLATPRRITMQCCSGVRSPLKEKHARPSPGRLWQRHGLHRETPASGRQSGLVQGAPTAAPSGGSKRVTPALPPSLPPSSSCPPAGRTWTSACSAPDDPSASRCRTRGPTRFRRCAGAEPSTPALPARPETRRGRETTGRATHLSPHRRPPAGGVQGAGGGHSGGGLWRGCPLPAAGHEGAAGPPHRGRRREGQGAPPGGLPRRRRTDCALSRRFTAQVDESASSRCNTQEYRALCVFARPLSAEDVAKLAAVRDLEIQQKTPVRVLHRRAALTRPRVVNWRANGTARHADPSGHAPSTHAHLPEGPPTLAFPSCRIKVELVPGSPRCAIVDLRCQVRRNPASLAPPPWAFADPPPPAVPNRRGRT